MSAPQELSIKEIRKFMLANGCKVTNHALVKNFKRFLTKPDTQNEARQQFKTYVNILATIKSENNQKYLILRKKYVHECPSDETVELASAAVIAETSAPSSPGDITIVSDSGLNSPYRQPPPYKLPPEVALPAKPPLAAVTGIVVHKENMENYRDCVNEFAAAMRRIDPDRLERQPSANEEVANVTEEKEPPQFEKRDKDDSRKNSVEEQNKENIPRFSFSSGNSTTSMAFADGGEEAQSSETDLADNPISVKEATRKFNRMASEEEAKVISPPNKKKADKQQLEEKDMPEVTLAHPKAKEWLVSMAKASYHELAKLANEFPELIKLQDPSSSFTALHWAAKHGNEDVVKLIAGTYKADVNARSNGGYTPLHVAMQFGRVNIFELLCNVYKANRDLMDWSGNKPLDYSKQRTSVSASTYSKIKARRKHTVEKDLGFLRIGSLNVRVKKTTEAFSNFLGVGNGSSTLAMSAAAGGGHSANAASLPHRRSHRHHLHHPHHHHVGTTRSRQLSPGTTAMRATTPLQMAGSRASVPINSSKFDKLHKSWGSADNIPQGSGADDTQMMPPPKSTATNMKSHKNAKWCSIESSATDSPRHSISSSNSSSTLNSGYSSMPTTPHQVRAPIRVGGVGVVEQLADSDSDSACGFDSNWSASGRSSVSSGNLQNPRFG